LKAKLRKSAAEPEQKPKTLDIALWPHQIEAWEADPDFYRIIAMIGGTGAGKTWFAPIWVYNRLIQAPKTRVLALGTGYQRHVDRVMMYEMVRFLTGAPDAPKAGARGLGMVEGKDYTINKTNGNITLKANGSEILFGSAENPLSLEGPHCEGGCWIDEAGMMSRQAWEVAQRRTGFHNVPILITSIPYFENWVKTDIYNEWLYAQANGGKFADGTPCNIKWIHCKTADNKEYAEQELERMRRTMRPDKFRTYYEGLFGKPFGVIYDFERIGDPSIEEGLVVDPFEVPADWPIFSGHDYGFTAPTTGIWGRLDTDNDILYVVKDYEAVEQSMENHVRNWRDEGLTYVDGSWGDPANPGEWLTCVEQGYPVMEGNHEVAYGIDTCYERMATGRLKFFSTCTKAITARADYRWAVSPKDEDQLIDKPAKPQPSEHLMDALRYLCVGLVEIGASPEPPTVAVRKQSIGGSF
jgi:hypothetical protein